MSVTVTQNGTKSVKNTKVPVTFQMESSRIGPLACLSEHGFPNWCQIGVPPGGKNPKSSPIEVKIGGHM